MSVHLSDNEVTSDPDLLIEVLNMFNLGQVDLQEINRGQALFQPSPNAGYSLKSEVDYVAKVRQVLGIDNENTKDLEQKRKNFKDFILMGKKQKLIDNFKAINSS
jgi:uncharacterized protein YfbU (UPF0304 family)